MQLSPFLQVPFRRKNLHCFVLKDEIEIGIDEDEDEGGPAAATATDVASSLDASDEEAIFVPASGFEGFNSSFSSSSSDDEP